MSSGAEIVKDLDSAAELIRAVNHRSLRGLTVPEVSAVVAALGVVVGRLAQPVETANRQLLARHDSFWLRHDSAGDLDELLAAAGTAALGAAQLLEAADHQLQAMLNALGPIVDPSEPRP